MRIEVWSDVVCPWCFVGLRNLEAALARFEHAGDVEVVWRAFELDPAAPAERPGPYREHLAAKYGTTPAGAQEMVDRMTAAGAQVGAHMDFEVARPGSTFDAHRLLHLARARDLGWAVKERLLVGVLGEGEPVGDRHALVRLGASAGLDADECAAVLGGDAFADDVRSEEEAARDLGISAVPFYVLDRRFAVPGAQPADVLLQVLRQTWDATHPVLSPVPTAEEGSHRHAPGCDGDSCST